MPLESQQQGRGVAQRTEQAEMACDDDDDDHDDDDDDDHDHDDDAWREPASQRVRVMEIMCSE